MLNNQELQKAIDKARGAIIELKKIKEEDYELNKYLKELQLEQLDRLNRQDTNYIVGNIQNVDITIPEEASDEQSS